MLTGLLPLKQKRLPSLGLFDFLGYNPGKDIDGYTHDKQYVSSFSDLFKKKYENMQETLDGVSLDDFVSTILPKEFAFDKEAGIGKEFLQLLSNLTIVIPIMEAADGKEYITGNNLTENEAKWKVINAVVQAIAMVVTAGGALAGGGGASAVGKSLAAMFISDIAAAGAISAGNAMDLPPALTAILALAAGIATGKIANNVLFSPEVINNINLDELGEQISEIAKKYNMSEKDVIKLLQNPGDLNLQQTGIVDEVLGLVNKTTSVSYSGINFNYTKTTQARMEDPNRAVPAQILRDAIDTGIPLPDPQGSSATMYYAELYKNGKKYNFEVLYDTSTNTILHFKYTRNAAGPLPKITS